MSNVQECIDLYLTDEQVSDAQFRAVLRDARARDLAGDAANMSDGAALLKLVQVTEKISETVEEQGKALVMLNRFDDIRKDQIHHVDGNVGKLTVFCDSLAGQVRVLRERLDNLEGR